ncbi:MAG: hypothetical protein ABL921_21345 [Pirellula sp.]
MFKLKRIVGASGAETRVGRESTITVTYDVWATTADERADPSYLQNAYVFCLDNTDRRIFNLTRGKVKWKEDDDTGHFIFEIDYDVGIDETALRWSFDTGGGTIRITNSRATARFPNTAPDHQGAIEVDADGDVQGVDVVIPALKLSCRKLWLENSRMYRAETFMEYIKTLSANTGKTNVLPYLTFAGQELLDLGASGEFQLGRDNEIEYHFAAGFNASGLTIGGITGVAKNAHDYLWIQYKHHLDGTKKSRRPAWAYVERVYDTVNFAAVLGL